MEGGPWAKELDKYNESSGLEGEEARNSRGLVCVAGLYAKELGEGSEYALDKEVS